MADTPSPESDDLRPVLASDLNGAVERLVLAYQDRLYRFALRFSGSSQDAEEIVQDAFVRAYVALGRYPAERIQDLALQPWLYQITLNVARNRARRRLPSPVPLTPEAAVSSLPPAWEPVDDIREGPEARVERAQDVADLADHLARLPERYRVALLLRFVEDLSYADAAAMLKKPVGTVKSDVHRGLAMLRAAVGEPAEVECDEQ